jgi:N-acetylmuramoyl-L-alanine amidase
MQFSAEFLSPNFSPRAQNIDYIILHYTEMNFQDSVQRLMDPEYSVSAHYVINEDGMIYQLVSDDKIAWHSGVSYWRGQEKLNQNSIGIELVNLGNHDFAKPQVSSLVKLIKFLMQKYNISRNNIIGHADVAPERKLDPGLFFPWRELASCGLGIWPDIAISDATSAAEEDLSQEKEVVYEMQVMLRKIGYKLEASGLWDAQTNQVARAFQAKFCPEIILGYGLDFYRNMDSKYSWSKKSHQILQSIALLI